MAACAAPARVAAVAAGGLPSLHQHNAHTVSNSSSSRKATNRNRNGNRSGNGKGSYANANVRNVNAACFAGLRSMGSNEVDGVSVSRGPCSTFAGQMAVVNCAARTTCAAVEPLSSGAVLFLGQFVFLPDLLIPSAILVVVPLALISLNSEFKEGTQDKNQELHFAQRVAVSATRLFAQLLGLVIDAIPQTRTTSTGSDKVGSNGSQPKTTGHESGGEHTSLEAENLVHRIASCTATTSGAADLEAEWMENIVLRSSAPTSTLTVADFQASGVNSTLLQESGPKENITNNFVVNVNTKPHERLRESGMLENDQQTVENSSQSMLTNGALRAYVEEASKNLELPNTSANGGESSDESIPPANGRIYGEVNGAATLREAEAEVVHIPESERAETTDRDRQIAEEMYLRQGNIDSVSSPPKVDKEEAVIKNLSPNDKKKWVADKGEVAHKRKAAKRFPTTISDVLPLKPDESPQYYRDVYERMLRAGRIQDCLALLTEVDKAGKLSLMKVNHFRFYEACKRKRAVKEAFTFLKLLRSESTLRNYTMLLSVCCHAQDIDGALRVLAMLESVSLRADCMFYTTLICACAKAGKVDLVFQVFHEMEMAGIEANAHTFGAMIDGCARAGELPKAFGAYGIMISKNVKPDRVIFNTLIHACGRAGAVQRAFDVLADMKAEATPVKPDHVTYGALISACARGREADRALSVYRDMRASSIIGSPECYTAAVHACSQKGDLECALSILEDLKKDGVKPDEIFFSSLIDVAGHSGKIEKAFSILQEMKEARVKPGAVVYSALMGVCSNLGEWEKALEVYKEICSAGLQPTVSTFNALMTALCEAKQLPNALTVLRDLRNRGMMPNVISYNILLKACEKLGEANMALELYTTARGEGIKPNLIMCDSITGLCLQQIQKSAGAPQIPCSILPVPADNRRTPPHEQWATWALAIYRLTVEAGARPTVESLSLLLGCLRKPEKSGQTPTFDDRSLAFLGQPRQVTPAPGFDGFGIYDPRALALVESRILGSCEYMKEYAGVCMKEFTPTPKFLGTEAASLKIMPSFDYTSVRPITINAETMPVFAAEVCLLTVLKSLQQRHAAGARVPAVTIKYQVEKKEHYTAREGQVSVSIAGRTGQGVAALLRRLRLKFQGHESSGQLLLTVIGISNWLQPKSTAKPALKPALSLADGGHSAYSLLAKSIADQQRAIRMGDVPSQYHDDFDFATDLNHYELEDANVYSPTTRRGRGASRSAGRSSNFQRRNSF